VTRWLTAWLLLATVGTAVLLPEAAFAEPYLAVQNGYKCVACHVNPTGGGLRNDFGVIYSENVLPAHSLPAGFPVWTGKLASLLRAGLDARGSWIRTEVPHNPTQEQHQLDQLRVYADIALIPQRLGVYIDEKLAPDRAQEFEGYVRLNDASRGWYLKAGKFYLPFGFRLQDQSAFVRQLSGISMVTADTGVEIGLEHDNWSAQLDYSNDIGNASAASRQQVTAQFVWVQSAYRLGAAVSVTNTSNGNRRLGGLFAGLRSGRMSLLGEADLVRDDGFADGARTMLAAFGELNWTLRRGHNLKLTAEIQDPDRTVPEDQFARWSALYEYTPLPFVQLRAGYRRYQGIPQNDSQNRRALFFELHGYL
jgi:hypothetical protein